MPFLFPPFRAAAEVEDGIALAPGFGADGLMPCVTTDAGSAEVLMPGCMDAEALRLTLETGEAHDFSRSRQAIRRKGARSRLVQTVIEARIDDDQDALWLRVAVAGPGASRHVGYRPCFHRTVPAGAAAGGALRVTEADKTFDPVAVNGDAPNPTQL